MSRLKKEKVPCPSYSDSEYPLDVREVIIHLFTTLRNAWMGGELNRETLGDSLWSIPYDDG